MTAEEDRIFAREYEHLHAANEGTCVDPMCGCNGRIGGGGGNKGPVPGFWRIRGWYGIGGGQTLTPAENWTRIARAVPVVTILTIIAVVIVLGAATVCVILMENGH